MNEQNDKTELTDQAVVSELVEENARLKAENDKLVAVSVAVGKCSPTEVPPSVFDAWQGTDTVMKYSNQMELLNALHDWMMKKAPQHYKGSGLYLDVQASLAR